MHTLQYLRSLGFAVDNPRFGSNVSAMGFHLGYRCQIDQGSVASESAPFVVFLRYTVFLKIPHELQIRLNPHCRMPLTVRGPFGIMPGNNETAEWERSHICRLIFQEFAAELPALYMIEVAPGSLCGYGDYLGEGAETCSQCLAWLIELARRIDWIHALRCRATAPDDSEPYDMETCWERAILP